MVGNACLRSNCNCASTAANRISLLVLREATDHSLYKCVGFPSPFATHVKYEGAEASPRIPQMLHPFAPFYATQYASSRTVGDVCDHRPVDTNPTEPRVGENDVEAGTFTCRVPTQDFLLCLMDSADVL